jgi:hypothetical protein
MAADTIDDLGATLRSSLSSTELVLAKFNESIRKEMMAEVRQSPNDANKVTLVRTLTDVTLQMQNEYAKVKASVELLLGLMGK